MAHELNPIIKREFDDGCSADTTKITKTSRNFSNSMLNTTIPASSTAKPNNISLNSCTNMSSMTSSTNLNSSTNNNNSSNNSAKMGSRRIFTPQFKLQVLESYRNDSDCKGNQRATARKYGIHRRQIQKWLQCETNLRSSVANSNHSTVKHQFHNISHQVPPSGIQANSNSNNQHHHHSHHHNQQPHHQSQFKVNMLSLDTARHSVALNSIPSASSASSRATTKCVNGANVSASVRAGAPIAAVETTTPIAATSALGSASPILTHSHQTAMYKSASNLVGAPSTGSILSFTPAIQSIPLVQHQHHSHPYLHHSHEHEHYQQHQHSQHQHQSQHHENRLLVPSSASLPRCASPVLNAANQKHELRDFHPMGTALVEESSYINEFGYKCNQQQLIFENLQPHCSALNNPSHPIDLSLGHRRRRDFSPSLAATAIAPPQKPTEASVPGVAFEDDRSRASIENIATIYRVDSNKSMHSAGEANNNNIEKMFRVENSSSNSAVDLSCRKRTKLIDIDMSDGVSSEKIPKTMDQNITKNSNVLGDKVEQQQGQIEQPAKPVKLFKPYLLDDDKSYHEEKKSKCEQAPIIWSYHSNIPPQSTTTSSSSVDTVVGAVQASVGYDTPTNISQYGSGNFPNNTAVEAYPFPDGSPPFHSPPPSSAISSISSASHERSSTTPNSGNTTAGHWCPKGSPVSGYDTASTYSDSSDYYSARTSQFHQQSSIYSLNLRIDSYYQDLTCRAADQILIPERYRPVGGFYHHNLNNDDVHSWLERDTEIRRQGIALYV